MQSTPIDITKLSVVELKAIAFDLTNNLNILNSNLQLILKELKNRQDALSNPDSNPPVNAPSGS